MTPLEKAARALREAIEKSQHNFGEVGIEAVCVDGARSVIEAALSDPDEAVIEAARKALNRENDRWMRRANSDEKIYDAMRAALIAAKDAILKERKG